MTSNWTVSKKGSQMALFPPSVEIHSESQRGELQQGPEGHWYRVPGQRPVPFPYCPRGGVHGGRDWGC